MNIQALDQADFKKLLASGKPFLVDYWAQWCVYCRRIAPAYEKVAQQYGDRITVAKVNIDDEPLLANSQHIEVIPTLVFYNQGKAQGFIVAPESKAAIEEFIEGLI